MKHYLFSNVFGSFVFSESFELVEQGDGKSLKKRYSELVEPDTKPLAKILAYFKKRDLLHAFYEKNMQLTRQALKNSVGKDWLAIQTINNIGELDKVINVLVKRIRECYELFNPELSRSIEDNERFVNALTKKAAKQKDSIGADLAQSDVLPILELALSAKALCESRQKQEKYLDQLMASFCPNLRALTGPLIGAKLMAQAGSLKHLSELPASTVQVLGAEKALFRHLRTGAKPPKFGILYQHQLVQTAKKQQQGKAARILADKISIAVKVDFFRGKYVGDKLLEDIKKRMVT